MRYKTRVTSSPDYVFIGLVVILVIFGLVMLTSASSDLAQTRFNNSYHYLNHQILYGLSAGISGFILGTFVFYRRLEKWSMFLLALTILMLILVLSPLGLTVKGAARWLTFGGSTIQPAEILKLTFLIYLSAWLSKSQKRGKSLVEGFFPFLILVGVVTLLIIFQPSTTTAVIIFAAALITYFTAGAHFRFVIAAILLAGLALSVIIYITPYRLERVISFFNPEVDRLEAGYHIDQSLTAIGSGGLLGVGYGNSTAKLRYLPEQIGDSIFAVIAEEFGFVGAALLITIFLFLVWRGLRIARSAPDNFGRLIVTGFSSLIGVQAFINIAAVSGLIPLTGVPLPFISFGGTSLAVFLTMSGIIVNVSKYRR
ncbi:MAG: putative lipid II flippase FtsW [Patescibacteria group bacterium]|nr:putative lipid II flippase FtsW [Patescibacteria group bacterium]